MRKVVLALSIISVLFVAYIAPVATHDSTRDMTNIKGKAGYVSVQCTRTANGGYHLGVRYDTQTNYAKNLRVLIFPSNRRIRNIEVYNRHVTGSNHFTWTFSPSRYGQLRSAQAVLSRGSEHTYDSDSW